MLQKESTTFNADTSNFKKLKIFNIYKHGQGKKGTISFFTFSSIRAFYHPEEFLDKKKKRPKKARSCIIQTKKGITTYDKQIVKSNINTSALFLNPIPQSNIRIRSPIFYYVKRAKYLTRANIII